MLVSDILTEVQDYIDDSTTTVSAAVVRYINRGYREVMRIPGAYWSRLIDLPLSAVAGTDQYTVSATLRNIIDIRDVTNSQYLMPTTYEQLIQIYPAINLANDRGIPTYYYPINLSAGPLLQPTFKLYPVPNASIVYYVDGNRRITGDLLTTDTPIFPEEYHHLLADYAAWQFFAADLNPIYAEYKARYQEGLAELKREGLERLSEGTQSMLQRPVQYASNAVKLDPTSGYWSA